MTRSLSRRGRGSGISNISRAGSILHWVGMLAMVIGLFAPLATAEAAVTVMSPEQSMMKAAQQPFDSDTASFERVVLTGDFQQQFGCGAWDANCDQTRLANINGFWTGVFNVPPGDWSWELVAVDRLGNQYSIDDGQVSVSEGQPGIYADFNSVSRDSNVTATTSIAFASGSFGDVALSPDGDGFQATALNIANDGWVDMQVTVNGEPVATGADFQRGVSRVSFDSFGNITNVEHRGFAEVSVQRMDADGNLLPGSCFVLDGSSESRGCDTDGSQDGSADGTTTLRFPAGFQPGTYTLRETRAADGAEPLSDQQVDIQQGQTTIEARSEGAPTPETGDLVILRQDMNGAPVGGACFEVVSNGEVIGSACDEDGDVPDDGRTGIFGLPAGDHTLSETRTPDGYESTGDIVISILPNQVTEQVVQSASIVSEPTETEEVTEEVTEEITEEATEEVTEVVTEEVTAVGRIIVYREDDAGNRVGGSCFDAVNSGGTVVGSACDEDGIAADDGVTGIPDLPVGEYTIVETRVPEGFEKAPDTLATVNEGDNEYWISSAAASEGGGLLQGASLEIDARLEVTYTFDPAQQVACIELEVPSSAIAGMSMPFACDNDENDHNSEFGVIEMRGLTPGDYDVVPYQGPSALEQSTPASVTLVDGETARVSFEREEPTTTDFSIRTVSGENPAGGACYLIDEQGDWRCDDGSGTLSISGVTPGEHTVRMVQAPAGYSLSDPDTQTVSVAADGSTVFTFSVSQATTSFQIQTRDGENPVGGACYLIDEQGDWRCDDGSGTLTISGVTPGEHTVRMVQAPAGYNLSDPDTQTIAVAADGSTVFTFNVSSATTSFQIQTRDGENPAGGACYLIDEQGDWRCDDGSGTLSISGVTAGEHTVRMVQAPAGYNLSDPDTQTIAVAADGSTVFTFSVSQATTNFEIRTASGENPVGGACYLIDEQGDWVCDDGSGTLSISGVTPGEHTVRMVQAPAGYSLSDPDTQTMSVAADGSTVFTFQVAETTVDIEVNTLSSETGDPLFGACYSLDDGEVVCDETESGTVVFEGQAPAERTLTMQTAPDGFEPSAAQLIPADVTTVDVGLFQTTGSITVAVVDNATETGLVGFCARIGGGEPVCDDTSGGSITFDGLAVGEDHVVELTSAPAGYDLPDPATLSVAAGVDTPTSAQFRVNETPPAAGGLTVTVTYSDDVPVEGVCLTATHGESGEAFSACDSDDETGNDGVVVFGQVPVGDYTIDLHADFTPDRAVQEILPAAATVIDGETSTPSFVLPLAPTTGALEITTLSGGVLIEGACYTVAGIEVCDGEAGDTHATAGIVSITDLEPGTDIPVEMTRVPSGFQQPAAQSVSIDAGVTTAVEFQLVAEITPGSVTVRTLGANDDPLPNACYRLIQDGTVIGPVCDGENADGDTVFEDVAPGTYTLEQTTRPSNNYAAVDSRQVEVLAGEDTLVEVRMELRPGALRITTVDADDPATVLQGACYRLVGDSEFGPFCDSDDGSLDGRVNFTNIPAGEYELQQTTATAGFEPALDRLVTINPGGTRQITVQNARVQPPAESGTLVVIPLAPNDNPVPGGCYQVFDGDTPVTGRVCDNADDQPASITFENLPVGELTLRELLAPSPDWQLANDIDVTIRNGETTTVEVPHEFKNGHVVVQAVNSVGLPLQGACFTLTNAGDSELCTDATGQASVSDLAPGSRELTQTAAPFGYKLDETPRDVVVRPGQTTTVRVVFENEPPPNTGTVQVQKFFCPAGDEGERTRFLGGAQGNQELQHTAGCQPGVASFTLVAEDGSTESNAEFKTNAEGRAQLTAVEGIYLLTETDPDLPGNSAARIRVGVGQMTTVIVINYVAPPAPAPVTINVEGYTCPPGFNGSSFVDFQNSCMAESQLTNQITVRAQAEFRYKRVTGDTGALGKTSFVDLPAGTYSIWAERPHTMPLTYLFCGADVNNPNLKAVNGSVSTSLQSGSTILCRVFQVPSLFDAEHGAIQVHKFNCPITERQRGFDWENECERPNEPIAFEIVRIDPKTRDAIGQPVRINTNSDGIVQFPMLTPGTYKLAEVDGEWCFAQSNSVDAQGDVVVSQNKLSEVWVYNCVGTKQPPNTGSGDAADLLNPGSQDHGPIQVLPNLLWPTVLLAGWVMWRDRKQA